MDRRSRVFTLILCIVLLSAVGCRKNDTALRRNAVEKSEFLMGTVVTLRVFDGDTDKGDRAANKAIARIREIESLMSLNIENSEINQINKRAGVGAVKVSDDTLKVVQRGVYYSELSEGLFDITVGPLVQLWAIGTEEARIPDEDEIQKALGLIDYKQVNINKETNEILLDKDGMVLDLGGIAKGYAADEAKKVLVSEGVEHAIINLGGNILTLGGKYDGGPWNIGIKDPYQPTGSLLGVARVEDQTVVTSGDYERYFEKGGERFHHILNPFSGFPGESRLKGATVITSSSFDADAISTIVFLLGAERGIEFVEDLKDTQAILVTEDKQVLITSGMKDKFSLQKRDYSLGRVGSQ